MIAPDSAALKAPWRVAVLFPGVPPAFKSKPQGHLRFFVLAAVGAGGATKSMAFTRGQIARLAADISGARLTRSAGCCIRLNMTKFVFMYRT